MTRLDDYNERRNLAAKKKRKRPSNPDVLAAFDRSRCAICQSGHGVEAHHIVPRSKFGKGESPDVVSNLLAVCHACHQDHHTTAHKRIPRLVLSEAQIAFVVAKQGESWMDRWYPA